MRRRTFIKTTGILGAGLALKPSFMHAAALPNPAPLNSEQALKRLIDSALKRGAEYADARYCIERNQSIQVRKDTVYSITDSEDAGFSLRVYKNGQWGFSAAGESDAFDAGRLAEYACSAAEDAGSIKSIPFTAEGRLAKKAPDWITPHERDPFTVPMEEKIEFLLSILRPAIAGSKIAYAVSNLFETKKRTLYASSLGGLVHQTFITAWPNYALTAFDQRHGRIDSVTGMTEPLGIGYEITKRIPFETEIWRSMDLVEELQAAKPVVPGDYDIIMSPSHLWRVLFETLLPHLDSWSIAGLDHERQGPSLFEDGVKGARVASAPLLTLSYDGNLPAGLASCGWDDAGRPAVKGTLLKGGVIQDPPGSDELAGGTYPWKESVTRAAGWQTAPRFAMPNIILNPSPEGGGIDRMIADVERGILLEGRGPIRRDAGGRLFRAGAQVAWLIEKGKATRILRDVAYESSVSYFWRKLEALGGAKSLGIGGELSPARTYPNWVLPFSVAVPPALFRGMAVSSDAETR